MKNTIIRNMTESRSFKGSSIIKDFGAIFFPCIIAICVIITLLNGILPDGAYKICIELVFTLILFCLFLIVCSLLISKKTSDEMKKIEEMISDNYDKTDGMKSNVSSSSNQITEMWNLILVLGEGLPNGQAKNIFSNMIERANKSLVNNTTYVGEGSYFITEEGEKVLPEELKKAIYAVTRKVKITSTNDALTLLNEIGRENFIDIATRSRSTFPEIIALSVLYAIKVSKEGE